MKKKAVKKVYVASKYAGDVEANVMAARAYCRRVIEEGYMPMASHLLYPQFIDDNIPEERRLGMSFGFEMMKLCDEVWVFGAVSSGVAEEIVKAEENGITIRLVADGLHDYRFTVFGRGAQMAYLIKADDMDTAFKRWDDLLKTVEEYGHPYVKRMYYIHDEKRKLLTQGVR